MATHFLIIQTADLEPVLPASAADAADHNAPILVHGVHAHPAAQIDAHMAGLIQPDARDLRQRCNIAFFRGDGQHRLCVSRAARVAYDQPDVIKAAGSEPAENIVLADCLSTAMYVIGQSKAINYWRTYGGFDMILVNNTGDVICTSGLLERFDLSNSNYTLTFVE